MDGSLSGRVKFRIERRHERHITTVWCAQGKTRKQALV
jgi:hypothetical protein